MSTDGSGPEQNSINGRLWDIEHTATSRHGSPWRQAFTKEQKLAVDGYHPAVLAPENIARYAEWMESLGTTMAYVPGHDRRRIATFNRDSDAKFAEQEVMRRQLSMWGE